MLSRRLSTIFGFLLIFCLLFGADGYVNKEMLKFYTLSRSHPLKTAGRESPLKTAGREHAGCIPRLDPGLRLLKPQLDFTNVPFASFSLDWLKTSTEKPIQGVTRVPLDDLFAKVYNGVSMIAKNIISFTKKILGTLVRVLPALLSLAAISRTLPTTNAMSFGNNWLPNLLNVVFWQE